MVCHVVWSVLWFMCICVGSILEWIVMCDAVVVVGSMWMVWLLLCICVHVHVPLCTAVCNVLHPLSLFTV